MLNDQQTELFNSVPNQQLNLAIFIDVVQNPGVFSGLSHAQQLSYLESANAMYRAGFPAIDDRQYDAARHTFAVNNPDHEFILKVEAELLPRAKTVPLPVKMLSTDKSYSKTGIEKWLQRVLKAADSVDVDAARIIIRVTPKLDGYAGYDDGEKLYTRGDGTRGQDISRVFSRGLKIGGDGIRGQGAGEIVVNRDYFAEHLAQQFENSRNIQASIIAEKNVDKKVQKAIDDGAALFYPFAQLKAWEGKGDDFLDNFEHITDDIRQSSEFDVDGVIIEINNAAVKAEMGATRHHHRWQIAYKSNVETARVKVLKVLPQTARTGRISPVVELEPTKLSGAMISRATAHNYGMVKSRGIGAGAVIELVRSGLVIPKIERVLTPAEPEFPTECPSCASHVVWDGDNIICPNKIDCQAQAENSIIHFFKTLGNNDGYGPATIAILYAQGIKTVHGIYRLDRQQLAAAGFKEKTSQNLLNQLAASKTLGIEDWRFLSAFGVVRLGPGSAERLLQHYGIETIFDLTEEQISDIDGFAEKTAAAIVEGLSNIKAEFMAIYQQGFNLEITALVNEQVQGDNPIAGKVIVFSGSMQQGSRPEMEKQAKSLGAKVAKSVSGKTDLLVTGEKVGAKKISDAENKGVEVISEADYLTLLR